MPWQWLSQLCFPADIALAMVISIFCNIRAQFPLGQRLQKFNANRSNRHRLPL